MSGLFQSLWEYFQSNWPEILWILMAATLASLFVNWRARSRWRSRDFLDRLNISLTRIENGTLKIRTILEKNCQDIFLNESAARSIVSLARLTSVDDPMIPIPAEDYWLYLNALLNEVSERFALGQIKRDLGMPVKSEQYLLCLTCERAGPVRTLKVRGLLVRKDLLLSLPEEKPSFESPNHETRWETLQKLAAQYEQAPYRFIELEICA